MTASSGLTLQQTWVGSLQNSNSIKTYNLSLCVYVCVCMCMQMGVGALGGQKRAFYSLELELQAVVSYLVLGLLQKQQLRALNCQDTLQFP